MELFKAHQQWKQRPSDERFTSLQTLYDETRRYADEAREKEVPWADLRVEATDQDIQIVGKAGVPAKLTHWAFGQLCQRIEAPASYLRTLPPTLAAQNLNHGLAHRQGVAVVGSAAQLLFHQNGGLVLRACTSDKYTRIWNHEVAERLLQLQENGWKPANECAVACWSNQADVTPPLYASDHDMFAFVANPNAAIQEAGKEPLYRGVIVENSEVGASALKLTRFLYRYMCGNHIIWGASRVLDISLRHVGTVRDRYGLYATELRRYAESSASDDEAKIASARRCLIAEDKDKVLDKLFSIRTLGLSRKVLDASYEAVVPSQDGSPNSVWGMVQGITRHSQTIPYADKRTELDRAAGKIMDFTF